jgi:MSHA pilin protein MshA
MAGGVNQGGFNLIELAVVITILGVLAAFAIPRFAALEVEARVASTQALGGGVRSGAALTHALWLATGSDPVDMQGTSVDVVFGYPTGTSIQSVLPDSAGFTFTGGAVGVWTKDGAANDATCRVTYAPPAAPNEAPSIVVLVSTC